MKNFKPQKIKSKNRREQIKKNKSLKKKKRVISYKMNKEKKNNRKN